MYNYLVSAASCVGLFCATLFSNFSCIMIMYQEEETEAIKKLRKF